MMQRLSDAIGANRTVIALSMARLGDAVGNSILFVVIPLYVASLPSPLFPIPESVRVGILISFYGFMNSFLQPFAGALTDRLNRRKIIIQMGLLVMAASTLSFVFANTFTELLILRIVQGVGVALTIAASMGLMALATTQRSRGGSMGIFTTLRMGGFAGGPLLGGFLYERFGFNAAFYAGTAFIFLGIILVQVWVRDVRTPAIPEQAQTPTFRALDRALLSPGIVAAAVASFMMASAFSMIVTLEQQFNERLQETALAFAVAFSALAISRLIFQIPIGWGSDRWGRKVFIVWGSIAMAPVTALLGFVTTTLQLVGLRVLQGITSAAIAAPAFAVAADLSRKGGEGRQMSFVTMGFGLGIATGPLIAGLLAVVSFELPFLIGGVLSLIGAWVAWRYIPETVKRTPSGPPQSSEDQ